MTRFTHCYLQWPCIYVCGRVQKCACLRVYGTLLAESILLPRDCNCNTWQYAFCSLETVTSTHGSKLQHTAIRILVPRDSNCNTLQRTETLCNTLQHASCCIETATASHCSALQTASRSRNTATAATTRTPSSCLPLLREIIDEPHRTQHTRKLKERSKS